MQCARGSGWWVCGWLSFSQRNIWCHMFRCVKMFNHRIIVTIMNVISCEHILPKSVSCVCVRAHNNCLILKTICTKYAEYTFSRNIYICFWVREYKMYLGRAAALHTTWIWYERILCGRWWRRRWKQTAEYMCVYEMVHMIYDCFVQNV